MVNRMMVALVAASLLAFPCAPAPALAKNQMGYQLLSAQEAAELPHNHGSLGLDVERAQEITDEGMTFDLIRVTQVKPGSPSAQAGFHRGDEIIAVDGRLFPSLAAFAAYIGSRSPGGQSIIDYIPAGGGPEQAQRIAVTVGGPGKSTATKTEEPARSGMSTRTKIGLGAAALLGCYELGCFSSRSKTSGSSR